MNILFCSESYPGRFGKIPSILASEANNTVLFLSFHSRKSRSSSGVIHARLNLNRERERSQKHQDVFVAEWEKIFSLGKQALQTFLHIRDAGFVPDMIFVSFFDGPAFFLRHAFPHAFIVSCFNGFRASTEADEERLKAIMELQKIMIGRSNLYFVRSEAQKKYFPSLFQQNIHVWHPYVDTEFFCPQPRDLSSFFPQISTMAERELVTVHMKGSSFQRIMPVILGLLTHRPNCLIALTFGSQASQEYWKQALSSLPESLRQRLFLAGGLDSSTYRQLLCSSNVHVFPEYTSPPLQEMLESMSCGTLLMTPVSDESDEFFQEGETMLALPKEGRQQLEAICRVLDRRAEFDGIRRNARKKIITHCSEQIAVTGQMAFVMKEYRKMDELRLFKK